MRNDCKKWFADIESHYPTQFDLYYLCLIVGFAAPRRVTVEPGHLTDMVENFPGEFRSRARLLIGLLLTTDLKDRAIELDERDSVYRSVAKLVRSDSPSSMSDEGVKLMNQYAHGGFDVLVEQFGGERPRSIEVCLRRYAQC